LNSGLNNDSLNLLQVIWWHPSLVVKTTCTSCDFPFKLKTADTWQGLL